MSTNTLSFSSEVKAKLYGKDFHDASTYEIIEEVKKWGTLQLSVFWENLRTLKSELTSNEIELNFSNFIFLIFGRQKKNLPLTKKSIFLRLTLWVKLTFKMLSLKKC